MTIRQLLFLALLLSTLTLSACGHGPGDTGFLSVYDVEAARLEALEVVVADMADHPAEAMALSTTAIEYLGPASTVLCETARGQAVRATGLCHLIPILVAISDAEVAASIERAVVPLIGPPHPALVRLPAVQAQRARSMVYLSAGLLESAAPERIETMALRLAGPLDLPAMATVEAHVARLEFMAELLGRLPYDDATELAAAIARVERLTGPFHAPLIRNEDLLIARFRALGAAFRRVGADTLPAFMTTAERLCGALPANSGLGSLRLRQARLVGLAYFCDAMARNPEAMVEIEAAALRLFGPPLPVDASPDCQAIRVRSLSFVFEATARNPEAVSDLLPALRRVYGDRESMLSAWTEEMTFSYVVAVAALFEACARNPEAVSLLEAAALDFVGPPPLEHMTSPSIRSLRAQCLFALYEGMARQPELDFLPLALRHLGPSLDGADAPDPVQAGRALGLATLFDGAARQPTMLPALVERAETLTWQARSPHGRGEDEQAGLAQAFAALVMASIRQPELAEELLVTFDRLFGEEALFGDEGEASRHARMRAVVAALLDLHRSAAPGEIVALVSRYCGPALPIDRSYEGVQAMRMTGIALLAPHFGESPELDAALTEAMSTLLGELGLPEEARLLAQRQEALANLLAGLGELLVTLDLSGIELIDRSYLPPLLHAFTADMSWIEVCARMRPAARLVPIRRILVGEESFVDAWCERLLGRWNGISPMDPAPQAN